MKSRPESASIAMLSSYNDPAVPTTVFPDFNRSLTGFMQKHLRLPSPEFSMTPQSSPKSCGSYANAIVHEMQDRRVFPRHGGDVTPHHAHPRHGEEAVQGAYRAIAGEQPLRSASTGNRLPPGSGPSRDVSDSRGPPCGSGTRR